MNASEGRVDRAYGELQIDGKDRASDHNPVSQFPSVFPCQPGVHHTIRAIPRPCQQFIPGHMFPRLRFHDLLRLRGELCEKVLGPIVLIESWRTTSWGATLKTPRIERIFSRW